jgi:hypothetical protein
MRNIDSRTWARTQLRFNAPLDWIRLLRVRSAARSFATQSPQDRTSARQGEYTP